MNIKIDKSIPAPETRNKYPIREMEVGDSFEFPLQHKPSLATTASALKRKEGKAYRLKKVSDETARIWRVK